MGQKTTAIVISLASLLVWVVPPFRQDQGFFGCYTLGQLCLGTLLFGIAVAFWFVALASADRRRIAAFRACSVLLAVLAGYAGAEVIYLFVGPDPINPFYEVDPRWNLPDPELGFVRKPNVTWKGRAYDDPEARIVAYRTDENGFRNAPGLGRAEVVFIGDSFTEAGNMPEELTFVRLVGEQLGVTTANLGRSYYGPQHELIVLKRYALDYSPRTIVWVIFEGNDLLDAQRYLRGVLNTPDAASSRRSAWSSRSLLTWRLLKPLHKAPPREHGEGTWLLRLPSCEQEEADFTVLYDPQLPHHSPQAWDATTQCLREGFEFCRRHEIEMLVVFIPVKFRVYGPFVRLITSEQEYLGPLPVDLQQPTDFGSELAAFCHEIGCPYLDTWPALLAAAESGKKTYSLRYDTHLEADGHRVVADLVCRALSEGEGAVRPSAFREHQAGPG
ncbi:MAG: hypothetical protein JSU68_06770 [Phycisphaerales bacterium]|nr:MAG: hypothetical protein JSU68_06770 [Phycisphaerales bacterium]